MIGINLTSIAAGALLIANLLASSSPAAAPRVFRAGAAAIDVTPRHFPVLVNGMFVERVATEVTDPLHARCLALDDGSTKLAIVVVDSCMLPRELIDQAKEAASKRTGIPIDRMLVSATHTHSAASAKGVLGTPADEAYVKFLPGRITEAIVAAVKNLKPARIGWGSVDDYEHTHCRRWIYRPDKMLADPFGGVTVRANMHPKFEDPDTIGPSGPVDPQLSVLAVQSPGGRPIAVLGNYANHYFRSKAISADYYGLFASKMGDLAGGGKDFVGMMSQGTSGDQMWQDYSKPRNDPTLDEYASGVTRAAYEAYKRIRYQDWVPLRMVETKLTIARRLADSARLAWARDVVAQMKGKKPQTQPEVYALEQIYLHDEPVRELKLQALGIGDLGITAIPNEVFALSGLKIKEQSPFAATFNVELANGAEGYIPPPEQHKLGGYTTWAARSAALESQAEPRIVETMLGLLEKLAEKPRHGLEENSNAYPQAVLRSKPVAYWRLADMNGPTALDVSGNHHPGVYEDGVAFYLPGPESPGFSGSKIHRAAHFAGGRLTSAIQGVSSSYTVTLWFWSGLPATTRGTTGYLFARGEHDALAIGGTAMSPGRVVLGDKAGRTGIRAKGWNYIALVRDGGRVSVYLNGSREPELQAVSKEADSPGFYIGGRGDHEATFEGKISEVAVFGRALTVDEICALHRAAGL